MVKARSRLEKVKERGGHRLVFFSPLKGQLISKCLFGVIVLTKKPTKFFKDFCPSQSYLHQVLQTIQMKLILLWVWAEQAVLGRAKNCFKIQVLNLNRLTNTPFSVWGRAQTTDTQ